MVRQFTEDELCCCGQPWGQDGEGHERPCPCSHFWCSRGQKCILHCSCDRCVERNGERGFPRQIPDDVVIVDKWGRPV